MTEEKRPRGFKSNGLPDRRFSMNKDLQLRRDGKPDMRQLKGIFGVFGPDNEKQYSVLPSESAFEAAKRNALIWIDKVEKDFDKNGPESKLMKAFHDATGKDHLKVDFKQMKENVSNAKLKDMHADYFGRVDDKGRIEINSKMKMTTKKLLDTIVHESLHNNITYGNNKVISEDTEHECMARVGEKNEGSKIQIFQTLKEEKKAKDDARKAEEARHKKAQEAARKGWETRRQNDEKSKTEAEKQKQAKAAEDAKERERQQQAEKETQARVAREQAERQQQAERERQARVAREQAERQQQAERERQARAAREQYIASTQLQSIFGFQGHPMMMHHPLMHSHVNIGSGRSSIPFQYGSSSPSSGMTFYKGGRFVPGGGRAPKGGGYY